MFLHIASCTDDCNQNEDVGKVLGKTRAYDLESPNGKNDCIDDHNLGFLHHKEVYSRRPGRTFRNVLALEPTYDDVDVFGNKFRMQVLLVLWYQVFG
jgi:hypothetical protein